MTFADTLGDVFTGTGAYIALPRVAAVLVLSITGAIAGHFHEKYSDKKRSYRGTSAATTLGIILSGGLITVSFFALVLPYKWSIGHLCVLIAMAISAVIYYLRLQLYVSQRIAAIPDSNDNRVRAADVVEMFLSVGYLMMMVATYSGDVTGGAAAAAYFLVTQQLLAAHLIGTLAGMRYRAAYCAAEYALRGIQGGQAVDPNVIPEYQVVEILAAEGSGSPHHDPAPYPVEVSESSGTAATAA